VPRPGGRGLIAAMAARGRHTGPLLVRINRHGRPTNPMTRNGNPIGDPEGRITGQAVAQVIQRCADAAGLSGVWTDRPANARWPVGPVCDNAIVQTPSGMRAAASPAR
jgi:hypothetical protein